MATLPDDTMNHQAGAAQRDNLLGVCAALGEVTGIDPIVFRIGFVLAMLGLSFNMTVIAYCVAALALYVARR